MLMPGTLQSKVLSVNSPKASATFHLRFAKKTPRRVTNQDFVSVCGFKRRREMQYLVLFVASLEIWSRESLLDTSSAWCLPTPTSLSLSTFSMVAKPSKLKTSSDSRLTSASMLLKASSLPERNKRKIILLYKVLIWRRSHNAVLVFIKPQSFKIRTCDLFSMVFMFKMLDFNSPIDQNI